MNTLLTDQLNQLISQAYEYAARRFFINKKEEAALFSKLNLISELSAIPLLLPLVFGHNKRLAELVAEIIHRIVIKTPVDRLEFLDEMIRRVNNYNQSWRDITASKVKSLNFEKPIRNTICGLLCSHHNGYIREQAVKELLPEFSEFSIAILLIRVNDWVDIVSSLANEKVLEIIKSDKVCDFIPSLNLIAQLRKKERYDHSVLACAIEDQLIEKCYDKLILAINLFQDRIMCRNAFRVAARDVSRIFSYSKLQMTVMT